MAKYIKTELGYQSIDNISGDWNQNDENASGYIKNRPFYEGKNILYKGEVEITAGSLGYHFVSNIEIQSDVSYTITLDGTEYVETAYYSDTDSCNIISVYSDGLSIEFYPYGIYCYEIPFDGIHSLEISTTDIHQIDKKFIPDSVLIGKPGTGEKSEIFNDYINNVASGAYSHAEGCQTEALGSYSHSEGNRTTASGERSHAEGCDTEALGVNSHAEGFNTIANGICSHVEGSHTISRGDATHVQGKYNKLITHGYKIFEDNGDFNGLRSDPKVFYYSTDYTFDRETGLFTLVNYKTGDINSLSVGDYCAYRIDTLDTLTSIIHINNIYEYSNSRNISAHLYRSVSNDLEYAHMVGNGNGESYRSNAHTLDWDGNAWFAGNVKVGGTSEFDENSKTLATLDDLINPKEEIILTDKINGYNYALQMHNGQLVSLCVDIVSMTFEKGPDKTIYLKGEPFDPTGIIITAKCADGSTREITDFTYPEYVTTTSVEIKFGIDNSINIPVTLTSVQDALIDFNYTTNSDGTYTITGWKQTLNGVVSTEMVVPNSNLIIL